MPLTELLIWISQFRRSGTLELRVNGTLHTLAFERGSLIFSASSRETATLGRLLVERGAVSEEDYQKARAEREKRHVAVLKILSESNVISEEIGITFLRRKAERELFELLKSTEGDFTFDDEAMPQLDLLPLRLNLDAVLLRLSQQMDEKGEYDFDASGVHLHFPKE